MKRLLALTPFLIAACALPVSATSQKHSQKSATKTSPATQGSHSYGSSAQAQAFADEMAREHGLERAWVLQVLQEARFLPRVPQLMLPPAKGQAKNWAAYRSRFVEPIRIRAGLRFWQDNAAALARAEAEYGVPAQIIVGILGVETIYGQHMGGFRVLDALATLAFDFPSAHPRAAERQAFFRGELAQYLLLCQHSGQAPTQLRGSYAGAMGLPQFMPTSWRRWAVDFDGDGRIDLFGSSADAIGSVANYFKAHGWVTGLATHYGLQFDAERLDLPTLLAPDIRPSFSTEQMTALGAQPLTGGQQPGPLALIELHNGANAPSYVAGTQNFYVVTRYNWSSYYALAVIELGAAVAAARTASGS